MKSQSFDFTRNFRLDGKCAFVTGGSSGLGYAIAEAFAASGADVAIMSRRLNAVRTAAKKIKSSTKKNALAVAGDVRNEKDIKNAVKKIISRFGKIDILVTSAGINIRRPSADFPDKEFHEVLETNLFGTWLCCKIVGNYMIGRRYGRIITLGSMMSIISLPERAAYSASKAGVLQITRTLALEWAKYNITVNCICPGPFDTEINAQIFSNPAIRKFFLDNIPVGRFGIPEEVGALAVFLASDACPYMTGSPILVDGGWTAR
jgi:NAD(P)-dependent dehydrogenase (short-subunit alcohol dehydrogenase family)